MKLQEGLARDTRGAVLVVGIVIGALLVGALWHVASVGDAIAWRERAQDAADAGAFENAVWNARGMNVIAAINIVMSLVLAVLVIWRTIFILVSIALVVGAVLCVFTAGLGCGFTAAVTRVEAFMARNDRPVAENIVRILVGMHAAEVAVASATPVVGLAQANLDTAGSYAVSSATTQSAALLPSINAKGVEALTRCFKGFKAGKMPKKAAPTSAAGKAYGKYQEYLNNPRLGVGVSLPVQLDSYPALCTKAGEFVLNNIAGALERMNASKGTIEGIDAAKGFLGKVTGALPDLFCAPMGSSAKPATGKDPPASGKGPPASGKGPPATGKDSPATGSQTPDLTDQIKKQAQEACEAEAKRNSPPADGSQDKPKDDADAKVRDKDGKLVLKKDYVKQCTKDKTKEANDKLKKPGTTEAESNLTECAAPAKVWEWAVNGNVFMRSFAQIEKETPLQSRDDKGLEIADLGQRGNVTPVTTEEVTAHAEMYFDCDQEWSGCRPNAMWQLRWRARLRRVQGFENLVATAIEPAMVATLSKLIDTSVGKFTDKLKIPKPVVPKVKEKLYTETLGNKDLKAGLYAKGNFDSIGKFIIEQGSRDATIH
jgi:hypothetical protein